MSKCKRADCNEPRMLNKRGDELTYCDAHQHEYWRDHKLAKGYNTPPKRGRKPRAAVVHDPVPQPTLPQQRLVVIDPDTNRAQLYHVIPALISYVVPDSAEEFSRQISAARERGIIVAFKLSSKCGEEIGDAQ